MAVAITSARVARVAPLRAVLEDAEGLVRRLRRPPVEQVAQHAPVGRRNARIAVGRRHRLFHDCRSLVLRRRRGPLVARRRPAINPDSSPRSRPVSHAPAGARRWDRVGRPERRAGGSAPRSGRAGRRHREHARGSRPHPRSRAPRAPAAAAASPIARRLSASAESSTTAPAKATSSWRGVSSPVSPSATIARAPGQSLRHRRQARGARLQQGHGQGLVVGGPGRRCRRPHRPRAASRPPSRRQAPPGPARGGGGPPPPVRVPRRRRPRQAATATRRQARAHAPAGRQEASAAPARMGASASSHGRAGIERQGRRQCPAGTPRAGPRARARCRERARSRWSRAGCATSGLTLSSSSAVSDSTARAWAMARAVSVARPPWAAPASPRGYDAPTSR